MNKLWLIFLLMACLTSHAQNTSFEFDTCSFSEGIEECDSVVKIRFVDNLIRIGIAPSFYLGLYRPDFEDGAGSVSLNVYLENRRLTLTIGMLRSPKRKYQFCSEGVYSCRRGSGRYEYGGFVYTNVGSDKWAFDGASVSVQYNLSPHHERFKWFAEYDGIYRRTKYTGDEIQFFSPYDSELT